MSISRKKNLIRYSENNNWKNINKILISFLMRISLGKKVIHFIGIGGIGMSGLHL